MLWNRSGNYKRTSLYKYIISYILLLLLILGSVGILVRIQIIRGLENIIHESNSKSLSHLQDEMDELLLNFQNIGNSISLNPRLISFFSQESGYSTFDAARELSHYTQSNNAIYDLGVFYPKTGNIITTSGLMSLHFFFDTKRL